MKIKEISKWFLIVILLLLLFTPITSAQSPALTITDYTLQPEILTPGELGTVTVTIKNTAVNASADITDIYLFASHFEHEHKHFEHVGMLGGGSSTSITFAFYAPKEEGIYFPAIHVVYHPEGSLTRDTLRYPFPVRVNERTSLKEASLEVEKGIPEEIHPGDDFTLSLKLTNRGETAAHDIFVEIGEVQSIYSNDPGNYYIERLEPGKSREIQLHFKSGKDTPTGTIVIPIDIIYEGLSSEVKKQSETAGIEVVGEAELSISNVKTEPLNIKEGDYFTLLVRIENTGDEDANSVKINLFSPFEGTKTAFLGKIEPDDDAPATFSLRANKAGELTNRLTISYKDDFGEHQLSEEITLTVSPKDNEYVLGVAIIITIILLVLCGYYLFRRKR
ncbi:MAG: hypothetical protein U9O85_05710 [Euryarchaeota archaeon]|nr:hypothetical protein [Euryarchaeota archaeon]